MLALLLPTAPCYRMPYAAFCYDTYTHLLWGAVSCVCSRSYGLLHMQRSVFGGCFLTS